MRQRLLVLLRTGVADEGCIRRDRASLGGDKWKKKIRDTTSVFIFGFKIKKSKKEDRNEAAVGAAQVPRREP